MGALGKIGLGAIVVLGGLAAFGAYVGPQTPPYNRAEEIKAECDREFGAGTDESIQCYTRLTYEEFGPEARTARVRERLN